MTAPNVCASCKGRWPKAARHCPWCHTRRDGPSRAPEHLFASPDLNGSPRTAERSETDKASAALG